MASAPTLVLLFVVLDHVAVIHTGFDRLIVPFFMSPLWLGRILFTEEFFQGFLCVVAFPFQLAPMLFVVSTPLGTPLRHRRGHSVVHPAPPESELDTGYAK
jgi:hypothetical protein